MFSIVNVTVSTPHDTAFDWPARCTERHAPCQLSSKVTPETILGIIEQLIRACLGTSRDDAGHMPEVSVGVNPAGEEVLKSLRRTILHSRAENYSDTNIRSK